jgi:hypothetical protein
MAKLSKISRTKPIKTSVEGVFIRNLPAKVVEEKFGSVHAMEDGNQEAMVLSIFTDLICDEDGNAFEDCATFDDISASLSVLDIQTIIAAIPEALSPSTTTGK